MPPANLSHLRVVYDHRKVHRPPFRNPAKRKQHDAKFHAVYAALGGFLLFADDYRLDPKERKTLERTASKLQKDDLFHRIYDACGGYLFHPAALTALDRSNVCAMVDKLHGRLPARGESIETVPRAARDRIIGFAEWCPSYMSNIYLACVRPTSAAAASEHRT